MANSAAWADGLLVENRAGQKKRAKVEPVTISAERFVEDALARGMATAVPQPQVR
jgi:hypothetical protein